MIEASGDSKDLSHDPAAGALLSHRRRLKLRKKLLFLFLIFFFCTLTVEVFLRLIPATVLGFQHVDGVFVAPQEFIWHNAMNHRLFHDRMHEPKRGDTIRVSLLGDSYVQAYSVPIPDVVGLRLEHYLNAHSHRTYEVVSVGRVGWGQEQELRALERFGADMQPDWVVTLFLGFNDIRNNSDELEAVGKEEQASMQRFRPAQSRFSAEEAPFLFVRWSALNRLISYRLAMSSGERDDQPIPIDYFVYAKKQDARWRAAWQKTESLILSTRQESAKLGARYAIVSASTPHGVLGREEGLRYIIQSYPKMRLYEWDLDQVDRRLGQFCKRHRIPLLRLEPIFREKTTRTGERYHWKYDGHWNKRGNDLAGLEIAKWLLSLG